MSLVHVPHLLLTLPLAGSAPAPWGPTPSPRHLAWHELEAYAFVHFTVNTFTDQEWGYGDESPALFNPTDFDAEQIVGTAAAAGLRGLVLTCKHHDGFCLWPSKFTEHSVKHSPWRGGQGDLVREFSDACRRHGLKFGVYLSPWDRNHAAYGTPAYIEYYRHQLRELLTQYGPIFEVWFDGANGGDGFYGGAREKRQIDNRTYYDWPHTWAIVRELQPDACMFSDGGPDVRWCGNESGWAGETCWHTINGEGAVPGVLNPDLNTGQRHGTHWLPAEVDVSIRPGWFYHAHEDDQVKTVAHLLRIYFESVGRGANLILNLPPDRRGRLHERDTAALLAWRRVLDQTFAHDLATGATATADNTRGHDPQFAPANVLDGRADTYWTTDDGTLTPQLTLELPQATTFNVVRIREFLPLGQRIEALAVDTWQQDAWVELATATSIGRQRLLRTSTVTTTRVRLRVTAAAACPALREVGLFRAPDVIDEPASPSQPGGHRALAVPASWPVGQPVTADLGAPVNLTGLTMLPRQDKRLDGTPDHYEVAVSLDGQAWTVVAAGEFGNIRANPVQQVVAFAAPVTARLVRFTPRHVLDDGQQVTVGEVGLRTE